MKQTKKSWVLPAFFLVVQLFCFLQLPLYAAAKSKVATAATPASPTLLASQIASADRIDWSETETATGPAFLVPDPFTTTLRILTSLVIVIGLVFVLSWFLQKRVGLTSSKFGKVLGILPLDNRRFIYLVDILGQVFILGVTEQQISCIAEVSDKNMIDRLRMESPGSSTIPGLEKMFSFLSKKPLSTTSPENTIAPENLTRHTNKNKKNIDMLRDLLIQQNKKDSDE